MISGYPYTTKRRLTRGWVALLIGAVVSPFGGASVAATVPVLQKVVLKDTMGTADPSDDKTVLMTTGMKANRLALDGKGNVYVSDPVAQAVYKYNSNGHLVKVINSVHKPRGIAYIGGKLYVAGHMNDNSKAFVFSDAGQPLGALEGAGNFPVDIVAKEIQGKEYVVMVDTQAADVRVFVDGLLDKVYGPYYEMIPSETLVVSGTSRSLVNVRHRMITPGGVEFNPASGNLAVTFREYVETLNTTPGTDPVSDPNAYTLFSGLSPSYQYWWAAAVRQVVVEIDINTGLVVKKMSIASFVDPGAQNTGSSSEFRGLAYDAAGRVYVAGDDKVGAYDASTGTLLTGVGAGDDNFDVAYDSVNNRLLISGRNMTSRIGMVDIYGVDSYTNPVNTAPSGLALVSPRQTYSSTASAPLKVANAVDGEGDSVKYGFEIKDSAGNLVDSRFGVAEGVNGETMMTASAMLVENGRYTWRAQAFDGDDIVWSDPASFCASDANDNPSVPSVVSPVAAEKVSPFTSSLRWTASTDPDCYDSVSYVLEVSASEGFNGLISSGEVGSLAEAVSNISAGLVKGGTYHWRVKALDGIGGESGYSSGSFTYVTTTARFDSDQPGTKVYLDGNYGYLGRYIGATPYVMNDITPGRHFVTFVKPGFEPYYTVIDIKDPLLADGTEVAVATLTKAIRIKAVASNAAVVAASQSANSTPFIVDFDNDGVMDVVAGGADGNVRLSSVVKGIDANGNLSITLQQKGEILADGGSINVGSNSAPFLADYNNDGKKDLLVGAGDGRIYLFVNSGSDSAPDFRAAGNILFNNGNALQVAGNASPAVVDYNSDNLKDLVVGSSEGTIKLYLNIGTDAEPSYEAGSAVLISAGGSAIVETESTKAIFIDWNRDGKKDLVVSSGKYELYLNLGTDEVPNFVAAAKINDWLGDQQRHGRGRRDYREYVGYHSDLAGLYGVSMAVSDVNGAGGMDVLTGTVSGEMVLYPSIQ